MCTGIIFPGKCGVIEKKDERKKERKRGEREGKRWCMLRVIRTLFRRDGRGVREVVGGKRWEKGDARIRQFSAMLLDGRESND